jgi:fatty-acyl-CoA synthase
VGLAHANVIPITTLREAASTITGGLKTKTMAGREDKIMNLIGALEAAPADSPFITEWASEDEQETVTFGEFRGRARCQAGVLRAHGVESGDRVVVIMPQGISAMTVFVGAMMLGAVPAFLAYPNIKIEPAKYCSGLAGVTANLRSKVVVIDENFPAEMLDYVTIQEGASLLRASDNKDAWAASSLESSGERVSCVAIPDDSIAFIQHSAGTTGLQKGVALTHAAVLRQIEHLREALRIQETDRVYSWLPLYHDMGLIACFMLPMVCHTKLVMQAPLDWVMQPATMLEIISGYKCTLAWMPNFAFQFVPRRARRDLEQEYDLSSLRAVINCSEPVRASSLEEFERAFTGMGLRKGALQTSYAMAETVFAVTQSDIDRPSGSARMWADGAMFRKSHCIVPVEEGSPGAVRFVSSGRLLPHNEVRIVPESEAESLQQLAGTASAQVGEILIKSDCLFEGYYNRPDLTREAIVDGWYRTGDLGFVLDEELYVIGRKKDLIIVGGENIYPQDIEEIVAGHPAVHEGRAVALGAYNPDTGTEDIVVIAEVEDESLLADATAIEQELRRKVIAGIGVAVGTILLKPPKWIVKSTAGKPARSTTYEKLLREHPEFDAASVGSGV